jgi:Na+-translocating ferredoxin:NAD+ oxidoreductase RNF subunit RnfB
VLGTVTLILAAVILALLAVGMGWVLGWANRVFHVEVDPRVEAINMILPGVNCGGCGYIGCGAYAEAVASGEEVDITLCGPGGVSCASNIAETMGIELKETWPYKAVVNCAANWDDRLLKADYEGEMTCAGANLVAGYQGCVFGCLGLGDCVEVCDYDAIHMIDGLATVDYLKCTGCKACSLVCPRNIITMVPFKASRMLVVKCSNEDFGKDVSEVCKVGCLGCKACVRETDLMDMDGHLPVISYEDYGDDIDFEAILHKCKRESLVFVGEPTEADLVAVAEEELPERIEADFKTTVDDTEWRG